MLRLLLDISEGVEMLALAVKVQKKKDTKRPRGGEKWAKRATSKSRNAREDTTTRCTERVGPETTMRLQRHDDEDSGRRVYLEEENLVTDLVPSEMACLESSPGRMRRTAVWISRDEMVDFLL